MFHVASGNLGYQVEHHLFPDMPSTRYAEIAPQVKGICEKYELPYNTGPFLKQLGMVQRTILRLAFPGGKVRPKPGPYKGGDGVYPAVETATARSPRAKTAPAPSRSPTACGSRCRRGGEEKQREQRGRRGERERRGSRTRCRSRASLP